MVSVPQGEVGRSLLAGVFPKLRVLVHTFGVVCA